MIDNSPVEGLAKYRDDLHAKPTLECEAPWSETRGNVRTYDNGVATVLAMTGAEAVELARRDMKI